MRYAAGAIVVLAAMGTWSACDETTGDPDCQNEQCVVLTDGGATPDGEPLPPQDDGAAAVPPPFDAGLPTPTCKGLFELCSGFDCCSSYTCTNGTCR